jgi:hypothetical protein
MLLSLSPPFSGDLALIRMRAAIQRYTLYLVAHLVGTVGESTGEKQALLKLLFSGIPSIQSA